MITVQTILNSSSIDLKNQIFEILPRIILSLCNNPEITTNNIKIRRGIIGFAYRIANCLIRQKNIPELVEVLKNTDGWQEYEEAILTPYNELENKHLGGSTRFNLFENYSSEEDGPRLELDLDKILAKRNYNNKEEEEEDLEEYDEGDCDEIPE